LTSGRSGVFVRGKLVPPVIGGDAIIGKVVFDDAPERTET